MSAYQNGVQINSQLLDTVIRKSPFPFAGPSWSSRTSFTNVPRWLDEIGGHAQPDIPRTRLAEWEVTTEVANGRAAADAQLRIHQDGDRHSSVFVLQTISRAESMRRV
jgi:hypothetical protein